MREDEKVKSSSRMFDLTNRCLLRIVRQCEKEKEGKTVLISEGKKKIENK